jgi:uncharacterized repeat protein (TIGR01451 family)
MIGRCTYPRIGALLLGLTLLLLSVAARADVPVTLMKSIAGNVNFTGTQATMRTGQTYCDAYSSKTVLSRTLSGIPAGSKVEAAYVYWAGSGSTADNQITFDGKAITAQRRFTSRYTTGGTNYDYFGGVTDVTTQVAAKGNGTYTFTGLTINTKNPYCSVQGVLGGFALLVLYSNTATEPFRVLNVYEGFQNMRYSSITLNVGNFKIPNPLGTTTGRLGHITWEGDITLNQQGEDLKFNGTVMTDGMNPAGNQFNSKSNINGDGASYGVDFDAYSVASPIIQPDQTTATTVYSSGQDMVLLNVEIVAVPNVPVADLAISMTRSGEAFIGANVSYTLSVTNNGPNTETGPVTVTNTLPAGMSYAAVPTGTSWTCATSGQTATCTYNAGVAKGVVLPPITVTATVLPSGSGTYTNTAAVSGKVFDNVSVNNSATDTAVDQSGVALTDAMCTAGIRIGATGSNCQRITSMVAGEKKRAYITTLDSNGVPASVYNNGKVTAYLSLACVNPSSAGVVSSGSVQATYTTSAGTTTIPVCGSATASPTWSPGISLSFGKGEASGVSPDGVTPPLFYYPDVGKLQLSITADKVTVGRAVLVSRPAQLSFAEISRDSDNLPVPAATGADDPGFAMAGEPFNLRVQAELYGGAGRAPNFGQESPPVALTLVQSPGAATDPAIAGTLSTVSGGIVSGKFTYPDVGTITLTSTIADYLGAGAINGVTKSVGRFYPAYFTTSVTGNFDCPDGMACPSGKLATNEDVGVSGAAYSGQPFEVTVTPYNMAHEAVTRYAVSATKPITLSSVSQPGPTGATVTGLSGNGITTGGPAPKTTPRFTLPNGFNPASPHDNNWSAPQAIYIRAEAPEKRAVAGGSQNVTISSQNAFAVAGAVAEEDGLEVAVGRLQVSNAFGSELVHLPVPLAAQYWNGTSWPTNTEDDTSPVAGAVFTSCTGKLSSGGGACVPPDLLKTESAPPLVTGGAATLYLKPPGRGNTGSAIISISNGNPAWLPSTAARVVFGTNKSPVIYIREVY